MDDLKEIMASGGVSKSVVVSQMMANLLDMKVNLPKSVEATALGAAQMAALYQGLITKDDVKKMVTIHKVYEPNADAEQHKANYKVWRKAVDRSLNWLE